MALTLNSTDFSCDFRPYFFLPQKQVKRSPLTEMVSNEGTDIDI